MRYLHTMIRVGDIDRSVDFYTQVLGYQERRRAEYPEGKFTLVFLGLPDDGEDGPMLELTYNWGVSEYEMGKGYGHVALEVDSLDEIATRLQSHGGEFSYGPSISPSGTKKMAFVKDPDGYQIELLEFMD